MKNPIRALLVIVVAAGLEWPARAAAFPIAGQQAQASSAERQPPLTEKEVIQLIKKNKKSLEKIVPEITQRGVAFDLTAEIDARLRKAGAEDNFIANIKNQGPTARAAMAMPSGAGPAVPPEELMEFQAIRNELDPDRRIQIVKDFATKYPNSNLLTYAYFLAQGASLEKGDLQSVLEYGEKSLELKPDNLNALMLMAKILPQPQALRNEMNPDKKLDEAEKDGMKALELISAMGKPPEEPEELYQRRKAEYLEAVHSGLAMVHLQRALEGLAGMDPDELAKAEAEYKLAIAATNNPNPEDYFRLGEVYTHEKRTDDAIQAFTKVAELSADNPPMKELAEQRVAELKSKK